MFTFAFRTVFKLPKEIETSTSLGTNWEECKGSKSSDAYSAITHITLIAENGKMFTCDDNFGC